MSCKCTQLLAPNGEALPRISDDSAILTGIENGCYTPDEPGSSVESDGAALRSEWLDSTCQDTGLIILARVGSRLARFSGSGFIQLISGVASVVTSVPLQLTTIWHRWWKPSPTGTPILGEPLPYPYEVIADASGVLHTIKGASAEDSTGVWDYVTKQFTQKPLSELSLAQKGLLPRASTLELVGYAAIPANGSVSAVRDLTTLAGEGLLVVTKQDTVDATCACVGCDPQESKASVASFLAMPTPAAAEVFTLKFSTALGLHWVEDT